MTDKLVDKNKVNAQAVAFMEFFEKEFNVTFVDVTAEIEPQPPEQE